MTRFKPGQVIKREVPVNYGELGATTFTVEISDTGIAMREKGKVLIAGQASWKDVAFLLRRWTRNRT